eukprot:4022855-Amphidinium_carterae.1
MRALLMTFVGIRSGWLKSVQAGIGSDGPAKASVAKTGSSADGAVGTLRAKTANTMHAACLVLLDLDERCKVNLILGACEPLKVWHGVQVKKNRSSAEALSFYCGLAGGSIMTACVE